MTETKSNACDVINKVQSENEEEDSMILSLFSLKMLTYSNDNDIGNSNSITMMMT